MNRQKMGIGSNGPGAGGTRLFPARGDSGSMPVSATRTVFHVFFVAALLPLALLSSCRTLPSGSFPDILSAIPPESSLILKARVPGNEAVLDLFYRRVAPENLKFEEWSKIRERTSIAVLGLELEPGSLAPVTDPIDSQGIRFHLAAVGNWPGAMMGAVLGSGWTKNRARKRSWTGPGDLELSLLSDQRILISSGRTEQILARETHPLNSESIRRSHLHEIDSDIALLILDPVIAASLFTVPDGFGSQIPALLDSVGMYLFLKNDSYQIRTVLYPADPDFSGTLALMIRFGLSGALGLSSNRSDQELFSKLEIEVLNGQVHIVLDSVDIPRIEKFLENVL